MRPSQVGQTFNASDVARAATKAPPDFLVALAIAAQCQHPRFSRQDGSGLSVGAGYLGPTDDAAHMLGAASDATGDVVVAEPGVTHREDSAFDGSEMFYLIHA